MSNQAKLLRAQLKNVVQDLLPELLSKELLKEIEARVSKQMHTKMEYLAKNVADTMKNIDQRSKDVQGYLVRQVTQPVAAAPSEAPTLPAAEASSEKAE